MDGYMHMFRKSAETFDGIIAYAWVDANSKDMQTRMKELGLSPGKLPGIAFNTRDNLHFTFPEDVPLNTESISLFVQSYLDKSLSPDMGNNKVPISVLDDKFVGVKKIQYDNFVDLALHTELDVSVLFYDSRST